MLINVEEMEKIANRYPHSAIRYARMNSFKSFLLYLKFGPDYEAILRYLDEVS